MPTRQEPKQALPDIQIDSGPLLSFETLAFSPVELPYCSNKNNKVPADLFIKNNLEPGVSVRIRMKIGYRSANVIYRYHSRFILVQESGVSWGSRDSEWDHAG